MPGGARTSEFPNGSETASPSKARNRFPKWGKTPAGPKEPNHIYIPRSAPASRPSQPNQPATPARRPSNGWRNVMATCPPPAGEKSTAHPQRIAGVHGVWRVMA
ncbi:hypothetical protein FIBSPDRAFT_882097 [Athelia psychrophila]|uniref:Uncharacterized protein n=1 Tax=Athelia psychrophila TaxID=1759441 RepID=A0A166VHU0_9AGAM|nr:hypothetical protein FIBSPDRAFT_882097 [Fibularhizoctonia sp. CBS 109695]